MTCVMGTTDSPPMEDSVIPRNLISKFVSVVRSLGNRIWALSFQLSGHLETSCGSSVAPTGHWDGGKPNPTSKDPNYSSEKVQQTHDISKFQGRSTSDATPASFGNETHALETMKGHSSTNCCKEHKIECLISCSNSGVLRHRNRNSMVSASTHSSATKPKQCSTFNNRTKNNELSCTNITKNSCHQTNPNETAKFFSHTRAVSRSRSSSSNCDSKSSKSPMKGKKTCKSRSDGNSGWTMCDGALTILLAAFSTLCYINSLNGDFVHDDLVAVTTNPDVTGRNPLVDLLKNDFWGRPMSDPTSHKSYRPLTVLTFRWNAALWGVNNALSFHATNVALHSLVVLLLARFCKEVLAWKREATTTAAILFASHPVHTEAVSSIVGRADVLCCALYLTSLIAFARESTLWQIIGVICGGLALLAKEHGITVFCMCLTYQVLTLDEKKKMRNGREGKRGLSNIQCRIVIQIVAMLFLIYIRERMLHGRLPQFSEQDNPAAFSNSLTTKFLTYMYLPAFNMWLLLCPSKLSYDWQMGSIPLLEDFSDSRNFATISLVVVLVLLASRAILPSYGEPAQGIRQRKQQVLTLTLIVFPFLPASNLFVTVGFVVAERVLYIPSLGFCLLISHGLQRLMQRGPYTSWLCRGCAILLVLVFVLKTVTRNNVWTSRESLFASGLESVPGNAKVHYNYANHKKDSGDKSTAIEHYRIALSLWPNHASSHNNIGTLLDNPEEAEHHFREALKINPCHAKAHYNLATIYSKKGQKEISESLLLRAVALDPELVAAWSALASLYGDYENKSREAEKLHKWAVTLDPKNADALNNYGAFLEKSGRKEEARIQYEKAISVQPNHTVAIINTARSLRSLKHSRKAEELYKRALQIRDDPQVVDKLGLLYLGVGRYQEAKLLYEDLLNRFPNHSNSKLHYVQLLIQERSYQQAEAILLSINASEDQEEMREIHHLLASLYSLTNRTAEALDSILQALKNCSLSEAEKCGRYHAEHGHILKDLNDYESAEESYKLALLLDPRLATAHLNLAVIYHIKGNYTSAQKHYQEAYNLDSSPRVLLDNMKKLQRRLLDDHRQCWWTESACRPE